MPETARGRKELNMKKILIAVALCAVVAPTVAIAGSPHGQCGVHKWFWDGWLPCS
jgi:hypothetical protein